MKKLNLASGILLNVASLAFGGSILFSGVSGNGMVSNALNEVFGQGKTEIYDTGKKPIRFKTWYSSVNDVLNGNGDVAKAAESEGAVLLKNENKALPLTTADDTVSLFGVTAYDPMYSLDGAGEVKINADRQQYLYDMLEEDGVKLNKELASWYKSDEGKKYYRKDYINIYNNNTNQNGKNATLNGAAWDVLPSSKENGDTAIFVTGRMTNEGIDLLPGNVKGLGAKNDNYLAFTDNELSVLQGMKALKDAGKLKKIIVLFNQANPVVEDLPEVLKQYGVDAAMWIGFPGSDGFKAVADLLVGKASPSGGLSTTWFTTREANPSSAYYANSSDILMQEGIYLGYKYAETRYEDKVLGNGNTSDYEYGSQVSYPFGYGLSYATFDRELVSISKDEDPSKNYDLKGNKVSDDKKRKDGDDLIATVKVTNTSTVAAKEVVQLYLQKPYTETNKQHGVEKPSVELVGFAKTKKLQPGESETVSINIDANKCFASYDGTDNKYVVDNGTYYFSAARNSHEAINNILKKKGRTNLDEEYGAGDAKNAVTYEVNDSYTSGYEYWTRGGATVTNLFDLSDPNKASGDANNVTFMSRQNWKTTCDEAKNQTVTVKGDMNKYSAANGKRGDLSLVDSLYSASKSNFSENYPNYGKNLDENGNAKIQLADMIGVEYQDIMGASEEDKQKWEDFMDQLTWKDTYTLLMNGLRKTQSISSIGKPYTNDVNASNAISWMFDMSKQGGSGTSNVGFAYYFDSLNRENNPTGYPCEGIIAASFNKDLAYAVGQAIGEDGLWTGTSGLYGFGLGLHRNAYHGRAGEYYSEDSYLAGMMGGYESKGAQSKGMYVYNKHFVLNDQETNRTSYNTWLTEQTLRETYIRPFEIAIEVGDAMNVMNSFNHVGSVWSGSNYNLMTLCLRNELGMRGFAITDYFPSGGMSMTYGVMAGTDLPDGGESESNFTKFGPNVGGYGYYAQACRQAAQRILYTVANSNAMNFIGTDTRIISYDPEWYKTRDNIQISINVVFIVACSLFVASNLFYIVTGVLKKRKEN